MTLTGNRKPTPHGRGLTETAVDIRGGVLPIRNFTIILLGMILGIIGAVDSNYAFAQRYVTNDETFDGTPLIINPPNGLFVTDPSNDPVLTLTNGATSSGVEGIALGLLDDESGHLVISGGASLTNSGSGSLGIFGSNELFRGVAYLAANANTNATAVVTGPGSTWTNEVIFIGDLGQATMTISNGGSSSASIAYIGSESGSSGMLNVMGAGSVFSINAANASNLFTVGEGGEGTLNISQGGFVTTNVWTYFGEEAGSTGQALITGTNSRLESTGLNFFVGFNGDGQLQVFDGGAVSTTGYVSIGRGSGSGNVEISGAGSIWTADQALETGGVGTGTLTLSDGGRVETELGVVGRFAGSHGTVLITDSGSQWLGTQQFQVGTQGTGHLTVNNGGKLFSGSVGSGSNTAGIIGWQATANGHATITGNGSLWSNDGALRVGWNGIGQLDVEAGGEVTATELTVGFATSGVGTVSIAGIGSRLSVDNIRLGGSETSQLGLATLNISDFGVIDVSKDITIWNTSTVSVDNGTIKVGGSFQNRKTNSGGFDMDNGRLVFDGADEAWLEIAGENLGTSADGLGNFGFRQLEVGGLAATQLILTDQFDNGNQNGGSEVQYVLDVNGDGLVLNNGATIILGGNDLFIFDGTKSFFNARDLVPPGQRIASYGGGFIALTQDADDGILNGDFETNDLKGFETSGAGKAEVVFTPRDERFSLEMEAGSPITVSQHVSTLDEVFSFSFDALTEADSGVLYLLINGDVLHSWSYLELAGTEFSQFDYLIDDPTYFGLIDVELGMRWNADTGETILLDNWRMRAVPEPGNAAILLVTGLVVAGRRRKNRQS